MSTPSRRLVTYAATGLAIAALVALPAGPAAAEPGPIRGADARDAIPGRYLVVLKDGAGDPVRSAPVVDRLAAKHRARVGFRYSRSLRGFAATMSRSQARRLASDPAVDFVEQDRVVRAVATQRPVPSWGLDRIDQRDLPLSRSYSYPRTGTGVTAYVIDTGIRTTHRDFAGRAVWGTNTAGDGVDSDCNGHGTHVAGTLGGTAYGVAKGVRLVAVKVLDCEGSGSLSSVLAGVEWVTAHHRAGPAVANLSLGAPGSSAVLERAVRDSIADGVVYTAASGNDDSDACDFSPARIPQVITVNASTSRDRRAGFSNHGRCTDLFAPGDSITSALASSDTATGTFSGTSMAAPHVAGAAALVLAARPTATPAQVWAALSAGATANRVTDPGTGSPNRLLRAGGPTTAPAARCAPRTNGTDVRIPDKRTVSSPITVSGCSGKASARARVTVRIKHPARGELVVDLVTPNGRTVRLRDRTRSTADNVYASYTRNLSAYAANGRWTLRVRDAVSRNTGRIDSWTLDL